MNIFGFTIKPSASPEEKVASVVTPTNSDGSLVVNSGIFGEAYGVAFDIDGQIKNEVELINRYRTLAAYPEVSEAVEDIINEAISMSGDESVCSISVDALPVPASIKKKISEAFEEVLNLFDFQGFYQLIDFINRSSMQRFTNRLINNRFLIYSDGFQIFTYF